VPAWLICVALTAAEPAAAASVRSGPAISGEPDEIVVTGERVPRTLRDTASSVDVTTAERIEALSGADRIEQVLEQVPNVVLGGDGGPAIRGQNTNGALRALASFLGGARPRTTLQIDGRPVTREELQFGAAGIWDVESIEVFRTPQTTTQGVNSIAGAIFIHSKDPTYDWEGRARVLAGNYQTRQASVALSGPIVDDQLAFRATGDLRRGRPSSKIVDVTRGADPNNDDYSLLRLKLLGEPRFWPGSRIELTYAHTESLMPSLEGIRPPFRQRRDPIGNSGTFRTNVDSLTGIVEHPLASNLSASTTLAYGDSRTRRFSFPGFGETFALNRDFSIEELVDWNPDGPTRLIGGISHRRLSIDQSIDLSLIIGSGAFEDEQRSVGLFGEITLQPFARTTVTAGLRYQWDRQQRTGAMGTRTGEIALDYRRSFSAWLPKLSVAYDLTDEVRAGVLVQRAYNPGGTTLRLDTGENENFDAETLWNYELFGRGRFAGGAVVVAGNLFYADIRDSQRLRFFTVFIPGSPPVGLARLFNVPKARTYGAEMTVDWRVNERLSTRAAVGLLRTKITRTDAASAAFHGREFARSPGLTASGGLDWKPIGPLRLLAQVRHHAGYFSDDLESESMHIKPATFVDGRAAWAVGRMTLFGYVRNMFDTFGLQFLNDPRTQPGALATAHDPREVGLGLEMQF